MPVLVIILERELCMVFLSMIVLVQALEDQQPGCNDAPLISPPSMHIVHPMCALPSPALRGRWKIQVHGSATNKRRKLRNPRDYRWSVSPRRRKRRFVNPLLSWARPSYCFFPEPNPSLISIAEGGKGDPAGGGATMAYVERGVVKGKRTMWRLSIIPDFFKAVVNFLRMFFLTMFSVEKTDSYKKYGGGKKWDGGPGGGGGGPYGGGGGGGGPRDPRTLSDLKSNDQSSLPACGSCCG